MEELSIQIDTLMPPVVGHRPVLPFPFSPGYLVRTSDALERTGVVHQSGSPVTSVLELQGGEVSRLGRDARYALRRSGSGIEYPGRESEGRVVGEILRAVIAAPQHRCPIEVKSPLALYHLANQFLTSLERLECRRVSGIDAAYQSVRICLTLFCLHVLAVEVGITLLHSRHVHALHLGEQSLRVVLFGSIIDHHVPQRTEMPVLLRVRNGNAQIARLSLCLLYHG